MVFKNLAHNGKERDKVLTRMRGRFWFWFGNSKNIRVFFSSHDQMESTSGDWGVRDMRQRE